MKFSRMHMTLNSKWLLNPYSSTYTEHAKCNPDLYLPSKFSYTTGEQIYSPCDIQY